MSRCEYATLNAPLMNNEARGRGKEMENEEK